jgi:hypothetical protein
VLVELSNQAAAAGLVVTHAPAMYMDSTYYTGPNGILAGTRQGTGNSIAFLNYQTYGQGTGVASLFEAFVGQIEIPRRPGSPSRRSSSAPGSASPTT